MHRPYVAKWQPRREEIEGVDYRTYPNRSEYVVSRAQNMICQTALYRWSLSIDFCPRVAQGNLFDYLVGWIPDSKITKRHFGATILQAVPYNPRVLKGVTKANPKVCQTYVFNRREDLQYGLEWMICIWYPTFLRVEARAEDIPSSPDPKWMEEELPLLGFLTDEEWMEQIVEPLLSGRFRFPEPDWKEILKRAPEESWSIPTRWYKPELRKM